MSEKFLIIITRYLVKSPFSFFLVNSAGWLFYWFFSQLVLISASAGKRATYGNLIGVIAGYITSFCLHYSFKKFIKKPLSELQPWLLIFAILFIHANLWILVDFIIFGLTMYDIPRLIDWFNLAYYLQTLMGVTLKLSAWNLVYFIVRIREDWKVINERKRNAELHAKDLEIEILRAQLNPHFLFNSLNSIRALTLVDVTRSREMISELSEFLRYGLTSKNKQTISLKDEITAAKHFCAVEKIRFQNKMNVIFDVQPETEQFPVPPLFLHPLVENAIKYGMETSGGNLMVKISSSFEGENLALNIVNSGKWIDENDWKRKKTAGAGTGLNNVRLILANLYPGQHSFEIIKEKERVKVMIKISGKNKI